MSIVTHRPAPARPISVVVGTMSGWPAARTSLDALVPQLDASGGELIVADGTGGQLPAELTGIDGIAWLSLPGARTYELRQAGYRHAQGSIIAATEDHCRAADDWLAMVVRAHAERPSAAMIYGSIDNGTPAHLADWALYLAGYGSFAPPLGAGARGIPGHANVSWKRWIFDQLPVDGDAVIEFRYHERLRAAGHHIVADERLRVSHLQCEPLTTHARLFFHNGRAIAGLRRQRMSGRDWLRLFAPVLVAAYRTLRSLRSVLSKRAYRGRAIAAAPLIGVLHLSHALGEALGYLAGPGDAWRKVH